MTGKRENRPLILTHQSRGQKDGRIKVGWGQPDVLRWRQPALAAGKKEVVPPRAWRHGVGVPESAAEVRRIAEAPGARYGRDRSRVLSWVAQVAGSTARRSRIIHSAMLTSLCAQSRYRCRNEMLCAAAMG
jgi:hypothetical protein